MAGKTSPSSRDWNVDGKRDHAIVRCGQSTISDASGYVRGVPSDAYRGCFGPCGHLIDRQRFLEGESIASFLSFDGDVEIAGFVDLEESCVDGFAIVEDVHGGGQGRSRGQDHHGRRRRESQRLRIVDLPRQLSPSRPVSFHAVRLRLTFPPPTLSSRTWARARTFPFLLFRCVSLVPRTRTAKALAVATCAAMS